MDDRGIQNKKGKRLKIMERNECAESDYEKACRCITPPRNTPFGRNGIYEWGYVIDGYYVRHESGASWSAGEIEFLKHFQILSGKW